MYNLFLDTLKRLGIEVPEWFFWIVLVVVILIGINFLLKKYIKPLVKYFEDIDRRAVKIKELDEQVTILKENQLRNAERYQTADDELRGQIKEVSDKVSVVASMLVEMQERIDASNIAKLKDRIREIYYVHHNSHVITKMEKEVLEDLIDEYSKSGGNSFVHLKILPEIFDWEVVDEDYYVNKDKENISDCTDEV